MISSLLPYLRHHYPHIRKTKLNRCFTLGAIEAAYSANWDEATQSVITLDDVQVEGIADYADEDDEWASSAYTTEVVATETSTTAKTDDFTEMIRPEPTQAQLAAVENMEESVSTMGTAGIVQHFTPDADNSTQTNTRPRSTRPVRISPRISPPPTSVHPTSSSASHSVLSYETFESRISQLEANVTKMTESLAPLNALQQQLAELLSRSPGQLFHPSASGASGTTSAG